MTDTSHQAGLGDRLILPLPGDGAQASAAGCPGPVRSSVGRSSVDLSSPRDHDLFDRNDLGNRRIHSFRFEFKPHRLSHLY